MRIFELKIATIAILVALNLVESKYLLLKISQRNKYEKITGASLPLASFRSNDPSSGILLLILLQMI